MQLEILRTLGELTLLSDEWNRLPIPSPMQSHQWLTTWWGVYGSGQQGLCVIAARDSGRLVGLAPLYLDARGDLRWLGDGAICSDHACLLTAPGYGHAFANQLAGLLMDACSITWRKLFLDSIDSDAADTHALLAALCQRGGFRNDRTEVGSCYIDLPATWEEYLSGVSKNHRKRCRRWWREHFLLGRAAVEVAVTPQQCLAAWQTLVRLHNARRNKLGGCGVFEDEQFTEFHQRVLPRLAAAGMVQLRLLTIDEQTVAAEYLLRHNNTWFAYQSGLSEAGEAISAGNLSILSLVHDAISAGCRRVDLLRGAEPYKFSWGAVPCYASTVTLRRPTITGRFATFGDSARALARRVKRRRATQRHAACARAPS